jgi:hypothetical protein
VVPPTPGGLSTSALARYIEQKPASTVPLQGGKIADNKLVTYPDGTRLVHKTYPAGDAPRSGDAEVLGPLVARASGVRAPATTLGPDGSVWQEFIEARGGTSFMGDTLAVPREILDSADGRRLGIADTLMGMGDRSNPGNWLRTADGRLVAIDHGSAFLQTGDLVGPGPFGKRFLVSTRYAQDKIKPGSITRAEYDEIRPQIEALRPEFERMGRLDWYETVRERLDTMAGPSVARPATPALTPVRVAQARQAVIDERRIAANALRDVAELLDSQASTAALTSRATALAGRHSGEVAKTLAPLVRAMKTGDPVKIEAAVKALERKAGLTRITAAGERVPFDRATMSSLGADIPDGALVRVFQPGYRAKVGDEVVLLERAKVQRLTAAEVKEIEQRVTLAQTGRGASTLTPAQRAAVSRYGSNDRVPERINTRLRRNESITPEIARMDEALAVSQLEQDMVLFRGLNELVVEGYPARGPGAVRRALGLPADQPLPSRLVGHEFVEPGFSSTTTRRGIAEVFGTGDNGAVIEIRASRGTHAVRLPGGEDEILLDRGLRYRVVGDRIDKRTNWDGSVTETRVLEVEVLPKVPLTPAQIQRAAARERNALIESSRGTANLLAEVDELISKGAAKATIRQRLDDALIQPGQVFAGADPATLKALRDALASGDAAKLRTALTRAGTKAKVKPISRAGVKAKFDPDTMEGFTDADIAKGTQVVVVRRGSTLTLPDGTVIQLEKARVQPVPTKAVPAAPAGVPRPNLDAPDDLVRLAKQQLAHANFTEIEAYERVKRSMFYGGRADIEFLQSFQADHPAAWAHLVQDARAEYALDRTIEHFGLTGTRAQIKARIEAQMREQLAGAKVVVRRANESTLRDILDRGRMRTQFETKTSGGDYAPTKRAKFEESIWGYSRKLDPQRRPIYGYLSPGGDESVWPVGQYGGIRIVLKDSVRSRTSIVFGDSLGARVPTSDLDSPRWWSYRTFTYTDPTKAANYWSGDFQKNARYIETQIHGGVTVGDIDEVIFEFQPSADMIAALARAGIRWTRQK